MVQEAEKLKNNCPLSLVVNSITMSDTGQGVKVKEIQVDQEEIKKINDVDTRVATKGKDSTVIQTDFLKLVWIHSSLMTHTT